MVYSILVSCKIKKNERVIYSQNFKRLCHFDDQRKEKSALKNRKFFF